MDLYFVKDIVADKFTMPFVAETAGAGVRANLINICQRMPYSDLEIYRVCSIDLKADSFNLGPVALEKIDIDKAYKWPEKVSKAIKADEFMENVQNYNIEQGAENREQTQASIK